MSTKRRSDSIPETFKTYEEAANFWDEHDSADYKDALEAVEVDVNLSERHYIIQLDKETAEVLLDKAQASGVKPSQLASKLLHKTLVRGR